MFLFYFIAAGPRARGAQDNQGQNRGAHLTTMGHGPLDITNGVSSFGVWLTARGGLLEGG